MEVSPRPGSGKGEVGNRTFFTGEQSWLVFSRFFIYFASAIRSMVVLIFALSSVNDGIEGFSSLLEFRNEDQQRVACLGPAPPARGRRGLFGLTLLDMEVRRVGSKVHGYP